jgi:hypothetical protein
MLKISMRKWLSLLKNRLHGFREPFFSWKFLSSSLLNSNQSISETVDSEVFDTSPFQAAIGGSASHVVSSPYETPHYPIEIQENKRAIQRQINNRLGVWGKKWPKKFLFVKK